MDREFDAFETFQPKDKLVESIDINLPRKPITESEFFNNNFSDFKPK